MTTRTCHARVAWLDVKWLLITIPLSSHEQPDRTPAGTRDSARRKPSPARRFVKLTLPLSEAKWQLDGRSAAGVTAMCCACGMAGTTDACRRANEAVWTRSVSDEVWLPDPRVIIRQPERLESTTNIRQPATFDACARVAKGTPGMTSVNQRWRAGARRQSALADWPRMSVRHSRTRPMTFVNGNREWVARSSLLSAEWVRERSANNLSVEQREPTLSFERARIAKKLSHCSRHPSSSGRVRRNFKRHTNCRHAKEFAGVGRNEKSVK